MYAVQIHYPAARLVSLFLSFTFGIVSFALGLNAFVKSQDQKDEIARLVPEGVTVDIDDSDIVGAGTAVAVFSILLTLTSLVALTSLVFALFAWPAKRGGTALLDTHTLPWQGVLLSLLTSALFGAVVAMTDFFAMREAKVSATALGVPIPDFIIRTVEEDSGITPVYHKIDYREFLLLPSCRHA